jgi:hypothetical protein
MKHREMFLQQKEVKRLAVDSQPVGRAAEGAPSSRIATPRDSTLEEDEVSELK